MVLWLLLYEMNLAYQFQILNQAVCISLSANTSGKGMNSTILLSTKNLFGKLGEYILINKKKLSM